jgi:cytochrome c553
MTQDWILDVLSDLKTFARDNGMSALAEQLDDTAIVAMSDIAALRDRQHAYRTSGDAAIGTHIGGTRTGRGA